jgi:hypothetical protein
VESTSHFHHEISDTTAVKTNTVLDDAKALHSANRVFHSYTASRVGLVRHFLLVTQFATTRLLEGLRNLDTSNREGQKAKVLEQAAALS